MVFGHKNTLQIDLGDLPHEKERLAKYLQSNLNEPIIEKDTKLVLHSEKLSAFELHKTVTNYVYHHNLSRAYKVILDNGIVKIKRFKGTENKKETKKTKPSQTITQSWGL